MRDRVKSGLAAARARGVKLGHQVGQRPSDKKAKRVLGTHADGLSYRLIARNVRMSKYTVVMRARQLLDAASFGPGALKVIDVGFDAAWVEIAGNFSNDLTETEAARLMRADALLCCQRRPAATWKFSSALHCNEWRSTTGPDKFKFVLCKMHAPGPQIEAWRKTPTRRWRGWKSLRPDREQNHPAIGHSETRACLLTLSSIAAKPDRWFLACARSAKWWSGSRP